MPPLILTVHFDSVSQTRFDRDRQLCFPPDRNLVPAHLTLFHQLPETEATEIALTELARQQGVFSVEVTGVISLGRGVAYKLESPSLQHLRTRLADRFAPHLIPQDRQPFRPHVVLQNKTTAEVAH